MMLWVIVLLGGKKVWLWIFVILEMKGWRRRKEWYDPAKCRNKFSPLFLLRSFSLAWAVSRKAPFFCVLPTWTNHQLMNCKRKANSEEQLSRIVFFFFFGNHLSRVVFEELSFKNSISDFFFFLSCWSNVFFLSVINSS